MLSANFFSENRSIKIWKCYNSKREFRRLIYLVSSYDLFEFILNARNFWKWGIAVDDKIFVICFMFWKMSTKRSRNLCFEIFLEITQTWDEIIMSDLCLLKSFNRQFIQQKLHLVSLKKLFCPRGFDKYGMLARYIFSSFFFFNSELCKKSKIKFWLGFSNAYNYHRFNKPKNIFFFN